MISLISNGHVQRLQSLPGLIIIISYNPLFHSSQKLVRSSLCEYLHLIKKNSHQSNRHCEFFLIRCDNSQRAANQFLRWLEKRLYAKLVKCNCYKYSIFVRIIREWNNLPKKVEKAGNLNLFSCRLKLLINIV